MMWLITALIKILLLVLVFAISSIPLFLAVKAFGGKTEFREVIIVNIISAIIISILNQIFFVWGGLISFLFVIVLYKGVFDLTWWKSILAWFLQFIIMMILIFVILVIQFAIGVAMTI